MKYFLNPEGLEAIALEARALYMLLFGSEEPTYNQWATETIKDMWRYPNLVFLRPTVTAAAVTRPLNIPSHGSALIDYPFLSLGLLESDLVNNKCGIFVERFYKHTNGAVHASLWVISKPYISFLGRVHKIDVLTDNVGKQASYIDDRGNIKTINL